MSSEFYLSDRQQTPQLDQLPPKVFNALVGLVISKFDGDYFAESFPENCTEGNATCGTNKKAFSSRFDGDMNGITWRFMLEYHYHSDDELYVSQLQFPRTESVLEMLEFCFHFYQKPVKGPEHNRNNHHHLSFNHTDNGKQEFTEEMNRIFFRNKLPYLMSTEGKIKMHFPEGHERLLAQKVPDIETECAEFINQAVAFIRTPRIENHQLALEKLWDAFDRAKTLIDGKDKKESTEQLINLASHNNTNVTKMLNDEAKTLSNLGNNTFIIRHSETNKERLQHIEHIDYLFFRMYSLLSIFLYALKSKE